MINWSKLITYVNIFRKHLTISECICISVDECINGYMDIPNFKRRWYFKFEKYQVLRLVWKFLAALIAQNSSPIISSIQVFSEAPLKCVLAFLWFLFWTCSLSTLFLAKRHSGRAVASQSGGSATTQLEIHYIAKSIRWAALTRIWT